MILELNLTGVNHLLKDLQALLLLVRLQHLVRLKKFELDGDVVLLAEKELGREVLNLSVKEPEGIRVGDVQVVKDVYWQFLVRLPDFIGAMCIGAVLAEFAHLVELVVLTLLGLEVVIGDVQHLVLHFHR